MDCAYEACWRDNYGGLPVFKALKVSVAILNLIRLYERNVYCFSKKRRLFMFAMCLSGVIQFREFLAETAPREFENK